MKYSSFKPVIFLTILFFTSINALSQKVLFTATSDTGSVVQKTDSTRLGPKMNIKFQLSVLTAPDNEELRIVLPVQNISGGRETIIKKTKQKEDPNQFVWYGIIKNQPNSLVLLTRVGETVAGYIRTNNGKLFNIEYIGFNVHQISMIDQQFFRPDKALSPGNYLQNTEKVKQAQHAATSCCDSNSIDIMVVYTKDAREAAGGSNGMLSEINECVNLTNICFDNSQVPAKANLVHSAEISFTETGNVEEARDIFRNMTNVKAMRDQYKADIVILIVEHPVDSTYNGVAEFMDPVSPAFESLAYAVVRRKAAYANRIFQHEIGHIMGLRHQCQDDATLTPFPYCHGYANQTFETIMFNTYVGDRRIRIENWSDPNILYPATTGRSTGTLTGACQANEAEALRQTLYVVSKFRCGQQCGSFSAQSNIVIQTNPGHSNSTRSNIIWWILLGVIVAGIVIWLITKKR